MSTTSVRRLIAVPVESVVVGDEIDSVGPRPEVTARVSGANGQRYLVTRTAGSAEVVREFDRRQMVSVWR
ncbi:hypothetical protein [Microbacterium sp. No. 7]|uniref:hypothetical protein n=1 Tax=Microbacterium sp. No. 7 TaxID=1714373 RepID=UPI0006D0C925|nr:hypothetical protein [Microbacterium sp. No. 7]ALJ20400.1 hypothetical protein AOA12_10970 [Microbacterium sp. No. 7]